MWILFLETPPQGATSLSSCLVGYDWRRGTRGVLDLSGHQSSWL